jgi:hypothetical protein
VFSISSNPVLISAWMADNLSKVSVFNSSIFSMASSAWVVSSPAALLFCSFF